ncbi:MAG TPA: beta-propeller fold lactonase family protein, partial [Sphingobacterium sp.]|nr:beta-propeller fold lactonase family protein [Sphingobacterium sp.]
MNILPILIAIGTYTANTASEGIYIMELDIQNQQFRKVQTLTARNPSYLRYLDKKSTLYYVEEIGLGTINATKLNHNSGKFEQTSSASTQGSSPCHIGVSPDETTLIASNYSSGNFSTFSLLPDGHIGEKLSSYVFYANSVNPNRQKQSHVHSAFYTSNGKKVFIQDLGGDHIYQFDAKNIRADSRPFLTHTMTAGSGPRHLTFHSNKQFVYIVNELNGTIDTYSLNKKGEIKDHIQNISADSRNGDNLCAHIRLSPDEKSLYASNRGEKNSISVFAI